MHDESDLETGRLQVRLGGGRGGHNGLRSVNQHLGTPDFMRLRVGVGRPGRGDRRPLADYVLSDFEPADDVENIVSRAADAVETLDADGLESDATALQLGRALTRSPGGYHPNGAGGRPAPLVEVDAPSESRHALRCRSTPTATPP